MKRVLLLIGVVGLSAAGLFAQAAGGGVAGGLGKVFEGSGGSPAARGVKQKLSTALAAAVKREPNTRRSSTALRKPSAGPAVTPKAARPAPAKVQPSKNLTAVSGTFFKPDPRSRNMELFAAQLSNDPVEREQLKQLFDLTKTAFEQEVANEGRENNLAAALTFFIAATVTVYHESAEPSDEATEALWDGLETVLTDLPEMSQLSNAEKQQMYDMLIAVSGVVYAGHLNAKQTGDRENRKLFRKVAGELIRSILQVEPDSVKFTSTGLSIS